MKISTKYFKLCLYKGGMWARLFEKGFSVRKDKYKLFSERCGYIKYFYAFGWKITLLK